jgi:glycosyltransferase involved in cell wall biosynthesis
MASEKQNKISVIIPVYKTERFLAAALDSLVAQTYENWEAVCVNDGSPDNCIDILKEYSKRDNRIKIISQENSGVGKARNTGLKNITGKYVTFLDSDDTIDSRWLEVMAALAQEHDGDLISLSHREVPPDFSLNSCDAPLLKDFSSAKIVSGKKDCMYTLWSGNAYLNCGIWNKMWKASIVKNVLFDERIKMGEDTIFWKDFMKTYELDCPELGFTLLYEAINENGERSMHWAYWARSFLKLERLGIIQLDQINTVGTINSLNIDRFHITLFGLKLLTYI